MVDSNIKVICYTGKEVGELIPQIASLRMEVFPEYPFLYIGDYEYEKRYLQKFTKMNDAIVVAVFDRNTLIGISTGYPFTYEAENLRSLFLSHGRNPADYFCFGESVLRKTYRSLGIGKVFFEKREAHVMRCNRYQQICFYTILRPPHDPKRPPDYRPLTPFWQSMGYVEHPELIGEVPYQEIGEKEESPKKMIFWLKPVRPAEGSPPFPPSST